MRETFLQLVLLGLSQKGWFLRQVATPPAAPLVRALLPAVHHISYPSGHPHLPQETHNVRSALISQVDVEESCSSARLSIHPTAVERACRTSRPERARV